MVTKAMLAEFSYFMEKYLGQTSVIWSIVFMAFCGAVVLSVLLKAAEIIILYRKKEKIEKVRDYISYLYISLTFAYSILFDILLKSAHGWCSKLHRVQSNFEYVLSFAANRNLFFQALSLSGSDANKNNLFNIALYLNDTQWQKVVDTADGSGWYFKKVYNAITEILRIGKYHLSLPVMYQGGLSIIPALLIAVFGIILFMKGKKIAGSLLFIYCVICILFAFGTSMFSCIMLYCGFFFFACLKNINTQFLRKN